MTEAAPASARFADYLELTKPRLSLLSVLTAMVGYFAARPREIAERRDRAESLVVDAAPVPRDASGERA